MGSRAVPQSNSRGGLFGGMGSGAAAHINSDHGFSSMGSRGGGGGGGRRK
jgi:hypothetical protein